MSPSEPDKPGALRILVWGRTTAHGSPLVSRLRAAGGERSPAVIDLRGEADSAGFALAASRCDVAVLLADAPAGVDQDLRQRIGIAQLLGLRHLVLAIHTEGDTGPGAFARIAADFTRFAEPLGFATCLAISLSPEAASGADHGDPSLLSLLEGARIAPEHAGMPFRMPLDDASEGTALRGTVVSGRVRPGDAIVAAGSGRGAKVLTVSTAGAERPEAVSGETVTLRVDTAMDTLAGEVLASAADRPETCDQFAARLLWASEEPLLPGRAYRMQVGTRQVPASVTRIKHRIDAANAAPLAAGTLRAGDTGQVNLSLAEAIVFEPFERNRALGAFTLSEPLSGRTVAAGRIDFALRRAANIHRQAIDVTKAARAAAKAQRPALLWFTGLSGSGKSTIANLVEKRLFALGHHTYLLDGDNVRHGLNRDLGFTAEDRVENIRRVAETAKLMVDAGLITLASFISPFRAERRLARDLLAAGEFIEVFVDAPLGVAEARDPKGLYAQARAGRIPNFTGIDSPYEAPEAPELHLETDRRSAEALADEVVAYLERAGFLAPASG